MVVVIKARLMPESPDVDLAVLEESVKKLLSHFGGNFHSAEHEKVAFGLTALVLTFTVPDSVSSSAVEEKLSKLRGVSSATLIDVRRAVG